MNLKSQPNSAFPFAAVILSACAVLSSPAHSQVVVNTAAGIGADSYVASNNNNNNGTAATMEVSRVIGNTNRATFLRFDIAGALAGDPSSLIDNPTLRLVSSNGAPNVGDLDILSFALYGLVDGTAADARVAGWGETTITRDNFMGKVDNNLQSLVTDSSAQTGTPSGYFTLIGTFRMTNALAAGSQIELGATFTNVTNVSAGFSTNLESFLTADANGLATFGLVRNISKNTNYNFQFHSKEATDAIANNLAPTLSFVVVPEPSTFGMLLGASGALFQRRRRQRGH